MAARVAIPLTVAASHLACGSSAETAPYAPLADAGVDATPFPTDDAGNLAISTKNFNWEIEVGAQSEFCTFSTTPKFIIEIPGWNTSVSNFRFGVNSAFLPNIPADDASTPNVHEGSFNWAVDDRQVTAQGIEDGLPHCTSDAYPEYEYWDNGYESYTRCPFDPMTGFPLFMGSVQLMLKYINGGEEQVWLSPEVLLTKVDDLKKYTPNPVNLDADPTNDVNDDNPADPDDPVKKLVIRHMGRIFGKYDASKGERPAFIDPFVIGDFTTYFSMPDDVRSLVANGKPMLYSLILDFAADCTQQAPGLVGRTNVEAWLDQGEKQ